MPIAFIVVLICKLRESTTTPGGKLNRFFASSSWDWSFHIAVVMVAVALGMFWREYQTTVVWAYCHVVGGR